MLQVVDDYPFHQAAGTFDTPTTDDPRWFDRYWFMTGSLEEKVCLITGIGTYPNSKRIDAYAMVGDGTRQWNLRVGRERSDDPLDLTAEELSFELREAMKQWHLSADGGPAINFDLDFHHRFPPNFLPPLFVEKDGLVIMEMGHFAQGGEMQGTLRIEKRALQVRGWAAQGLEGIVRDRRGTSWKVVDVAHEIEVKEEVPTHRQLVGARVTLTLSDGEKLELDVTPLVPMFIAGGGYEGGALEQGTFEGRRDSVYTVTDDGRAEIPNTIIDHFCQVTLDGEIGQGIFELSLGRYEPLGLAALPEGS
jgi:hypothetical protein